MIEKLYATLSNRFSGTLVANIPGVSHLRQLILNLSQWETRVTAGEQWISFRGTRLYADTSDHVASHIVSRGRYEPETGAAIERNLPQGGFAIDIGGHIGHHTVIMQQAIGDAGTVWVFEPNSQNASYIEKTIEKNGWGNVELFPTALSNVEATEQLLIPDQTNTGSATLLDSTIDDEAGEYTVKTQRLSRMLLEAEVDTIDLVKIDIEGGEVNVIEDLRGWFDSIGTIILELHPDVLSRDEIDEILCTLKENGEVTDYEGQPVSSETVDDGHKEIIWQSR